MSQPARAARPSFALAPVLDLRSRLTAAYDLTSPALLDTLGATLSEAASALAAIGFTGPLQINAEHAGRPALNASNAWPALAAAAQLRPARLDLVIADATLESLGYQDGLALMEAWRGFDFGVCMRLSASGPGFPLAKRGRSAITGVRAPLDAMARHETTLHAAMEAGITLTVEPPCDLPDALLLRAGFDRRIGPWR
jgi:hypothetical protein